MSIYEDEAISESDAATGAMSNAPDYSSADYDDFLKDAERDDRKGDHDWMVTKRTHDFWPSGDPRIKIVGKLLTAGSQIADLTLSPPPSPEWLEANKATMEQKTKKAIATSINIYRQLATYYGVKPDQLNEGDVFRVKVYVAKKVGDEGSGFARVIAFKPKSEIGQVGQETKLVPF